MALSDAHDMFVDACRDIGTERAAVVTALANKLLLENELDVLASGNPAKAAIQRAIEADRASYNAIAGRWREKMDGVLAYWGTQITTPSEYVRAGRPTNRARLLHDIRADMVTQDGDVASREVTWDSEPTANDDGIIDRLTVDEDGITIEGGLPADIDATVTAKPGEWQSEIELSGRVKGVDIFDLIAPLGKLRLPAVNGAGGLNLVNNPNLTGVNDPTDAAAVTSTQGWDIETTAGSVTHVVDTSIVFRGNSYSHKLYGSSGTRRFEQNLIVRRADRHRPRNYKLAVYKTGTPTGTLTVTWDGKSQAFDIATDLSAGWNYLRLDRDKDLFPKNFAGTVGKLRVDLAFTAGDASNYLNLGYVGGQHLQRFNGAYYGHWSRNGYSTLFAKKTMNDSDDGTGLNQTALFYAYFGTEAQQDAYLRHIGDTTETIADYT